MFSPVFYALFQWLDSICFIEWIHYLAKKPLHQYVDRIRMIGFFLVVLIAIRKTKSASQWNLRQGGKAYLKSFHVGAWIWGVLFFMIQQGTPSIQYKYSYLSFSLFLLLLQMFLASFLVACLEEIIFRGFLWDILRSRYRHLTCTVSLSLIFSLLHFSKCEEGTSDFLFVRSFQCAISSLLHIPQHFHLTYFLCLFLLSSILIHLRLSHKTLWSSIGFHQGLVFLLLTLRKCFRYPDKASPWWGTGRLTDSWFVVVFLCGLYGFCLWNLYRKTNFRPLQNNRLNF